MNVRKYFVAAVAMLAMVMAPVASALNLTNETLNYQVVYHWGVVWKHAADATLSISKSGSGYNARLTGKTRSWADAVYPVRDTLKCSMSSDFRPIQYQKLTHEKKYYARDVVSFSRSGSGTSATCARYRPDKPTQKLSLSTSGAAYDMLSVFFMIRNIDFDQMGTAKVYKTCIFSGKKKETLTIKYEGIKPLQLRDKSRHQAYHLKMSFTQDGGKKSSDNMDVYISTDASRIPLMLVGKLPIGEVKCYYVK